MIRIILIHDASQTVYLWQYFFNNEKASNIMKVFSQWPRANITRISAFSKHFHFQHTNHQNQEVMKYIKTPIHSSSICIDHVLCPIFEICDGLDVEKSKMLAMGVQFGFRKLYMRIFATKADIGMVCLKWYLHF